MTFLPVPECGLGKRVEVGPEVSWAGSRLAGHQPLCARGQYASVNEPLLPAHVGGSRGGAGWGVVPGEGPVLVTHQRQTWDSALNSSQVCSLHSLVRLTAGRQPGWSATVPSWSPVVPARWMLSADSQGLSWLRVFSLHLSSSA